MCEYPGAPSSAYPTHSRFLAHAFGETDVKPIGLWKTVATGRRMALFRARSVPAKLRMSAPTTIPTLRIRPRHGWAALNLLEVWAYRSENRRL